MPWLRNTAFCSPKTTLCFFTTELAAGWSWLSYRSTRLSTLPQRQWSIRLLILQFKSRHYLGKDFAMASRVIAQILIMGGTFVARTLIQAYQQALVNSARAGGAGGAGAAARSIRGRLTSEQAADILGVKKSAGLKEIYSKYDRLFTANDPSKGGSLYLQAKIHNAMAQLEKEAVARGEAARSTTGSNNPSATSSTPSSPPESQ